MKLPRPFAIAAIAAGFLGIAATSGFLGIAATSASAANYPTVHQSGSEIVFQTYRGEVIADLHNIRWGLKAKVAEYGTGIYTDLESDGRWHSYSVGFDAYDIKAGRFDMVYVYDTNWKAISPLPVEGLWNGHVYAIQT